MTTSRQLEANRANARLSTGPKTQRGKQRSSRSAVRHGLSIPVVSVSLLSKEAEQLAQEIAGESASGVLLDHARRVAEAQLDLQRIRRARNEIFASMAADAGGTHTARALGTHLRKLRLLDRYERRARSRRKKSVRDFECATILDSIL
jgi:hypothetical protein